MPGNPHALSIPKNLKTFYLVSISDAKLGTISHWKQIFISVLAKKCSFIDLYQLFAHT